LRRTGKGCELKLKRQKGTLGPFPESVERGIIDAVIKKDEEKPRTFSP